MAEAAENGAGALARQQAAILEAERQIRSVEEKIAQTRKQMAELFIPESVTKARERAEELRAAIEELQAPLKAAGTDPEVIAQMTQRFEEARRHLELMRQQAEVLEFAIDQIGKTAKDFGEEFREALDDLILKGEDLKEVLRGLVEDLRNILFQRLVREPVRRLADEIFGGILSLGGSLLFGGGGSGGGGTLPGRQHGGPVSAGQAYLVGERGPEPFIPGRSGTVLPTSALGGGTVVYIDARGSNGDAAVEAAVQRGIARAAPLLINASVEKVKDARLRDPRLFGSTI
jgi:hypothetical protein